MNMKKVQLIIVCMLIINVLSINAQTPVWQGKGRIAMSSDGNEHDHDDWAATPLGLALLAASGLQDNLAIYTYSDHIWGSNQGHPSSKSGLNAYEHMRVSALGAQKWFGFDSTKFICAVDNAEVAYMALRDVINESTEENPLIILAAGPMQVVGEAISRADVSKRQFVTLISHAGWNDNHSDKPNNVYWENHSGWTFQEIKDNFSGDEGGNVNCIHIKNQNGGTDYDGLKSPVANFDWMKTSKVKHNKAYKEGAMEWLYSRLETCIKDGDIDASDAGMVVYMLTGIEKTDPEMVKHIMENN
jgi:hypothetical protein